MPTAITDELARFLESGLSVLVGTRDAAGYPTALRCAAGRASADRSQLLVMVPLATGERTLANVRDNGRLAVTFSKPSTYRSIQLKGHVVDIHETPSDERAWVERYREGFADELELVGIARSITRRLRVWPSVTLTMTVDAMFDQAPGPAAGRPYEAPSR
ncbi:MAG: pyridoxamine 5'-phosphate oxidase family protein [Deltaproteobacteria bacterium]|nr:pyridoxamine 5'-phosphate oxidase family protein [Deltaproteobacteria bacterium]